MDHVQNNGAETVDRRDFLLISTAVVGTAGTALALWPFIDSMNPAADIAALAETEVFLGPIEPGQRITAVWRGKPVFIARRTDKEITRAAADDSAVMPDFQIDGKRVQNAEWLVVVGICTHLGCIPLGQRAGDPIGKYGGWFCPCHGSHYDTSGRIRLGPAPKNLAVPPYLFDQPDVVVIG